MHLLTSETVIPATKCVYLSLLFTICVGAAWACFQAGIRVEEVAPAGLIDDVAKIITVLLNKEQK